MFNRPASWKFLQKEHSVVSSTCHLNDPLKETLTDLCLKGHLFKPRRWVCWTPKSDLGSTTKCDQNHKIISKTIMNFVKHGGLRICLNLPFKRSLKRNLTNLFLKGHLFKPRRWVCWTPNSYLGNTTKCDQNHILDYYELCQA